MEQAAEEMRGIPAVMTQAELSMTPRCLLSDSGASGTRGAIGASGAGWGASGVRGVERICSELDHSLSWTTPLAPPAPQRCQA